MAGRVTQVVIQPVQGGTADEARVTQFVVQPVTGGTADEARVTQFVVQYILGPETLKRVKLAARLQTRGLLTAASFEGDTTDLERYTYWVSDPNSANCAISTTEARTGSRSAQLRNGEHWFGVELPTAYHELIVGMAIKLSAENVGDRPILGFRSKTEWQGELCITASNQLKYYRGPSRSGGVSVGNSTNTMSNVTTAWNYVEVRIVFDDTAGSIEAKVNGAAFWSATGLDTNNGLGGEIDFLTIGGGSNAVSSTYYCYVDDLYVLAPTDSGTLSNFLGPVSVISLAPDGAGDSTQWTATGGSNYAVVQSFDTANYVTSTADSNVDLYTIGDMPAGDQPIFGVGVMANGFGAGRRIALKLKDNGTTLTRNVVLSNPTVGSTSAQPLSTIFVLNGSSTDWARADVNAVQVGIQPGT